MKRFIILFLLVSISSSYSQFLKDYGIKAGGTLSNMKWEYSQKLRINDYEPDVKAGFNVGVFAEFLDISFFSIVTEVNYVQKGAKNEFIATTAESPEGNGNTVLWKLGINYINISVLLKPNIDLGVVRPYLLIGPRLDYELNKSVTNDLSSQYDVFKKSRIGIKFGLGSEINVIGKRFLCEIIYDPDFSEIYENEFVKIRTGSFDIRVGIFL